jgi:hypothetical protein
MAVCSYHQRIIIKMLTENLPSKNIFVKNPIT